MIGNNSNKKDENHFSFLIIVLVFFGIVMISPYFGAIERIILGIRLFFLKCYYSFWTRLLFAFTVSGLTVVFGEKLFLKIAKKRREKRLRKSLYRETEDSVLSGIDKKSGKSIYVTHSQRTMHTQIVGTTNAGKTESVILPWAIQDIYKGHGLIIIDGKSDRSLLNKLWAYTCEAKRKKDFLLFSLSHMDKSFQYNPLIGKNPEEVIERVFSAFEFDDVYYKNVQYEVFSNLIWLFFHSKTSLTFKRLYTALTNDDYLRTLDQGHKEKELRKWVSGFLALPPLEREQRVSGLKTSISQFAQGRTSELFDTIQPHIDLNVAFKKNRIIYFQLPVLLHPFLGRATGKMVLQSLQNAVANRHRGGRGNKKPKFYSLFLDDFTEYLYPGFVSILNKSRSANVGVVFSHQALGDIKVLGDGVANSILTNSNIKIFMRNTDPSSAEYFSSLIGTRKSRRVTERHKKTWGSQNATGDQSIREVDEFIVHPNRFKKDMGTGEAVMVVPLFNCSRTLDVRFEMVPDIKVQAMPKIRKIKPRELKINQINQVKKKETNKNQKNQSPKKGDDPMQIMERGDS